MSNQKELKIIYRFLVQRARNNRYASYGQLAKKLGRKWKQERFKIPTYLGELLRICKKRNWPAFSAIVVNKKDIDTGKLEGSALEGFTLGARNAGYDFENATDFVRDQQRLMFSWAETAPDELDFDESVDYSKKSTKSVEDLFRDANRKFWFVGASFDGVDQTERFTTKGIWENGHQDKFSHYVNEMNPGDCIAIKASFTRRYELPFGNRDEFVSCMRIKATGTITESTTDGFTVKVNWENPDDSREWYFYTYRNTVTRADPSVDYARRLILFAFGNHKQDYDIFLSDPYWAERYNTEAGGDDHLEPDRNLPKYEIADISNDGCFLSEHRLNLILDKFKNKRNMILQGPPGTGKTWLAKRMGYALLGTDDLELVRDRMRTIQFHPSLSYEDFVRGWRPDSNGELALTDGIFLDCVIAAKAVPDWPFVLLIEEINRGNPAQIFGEMLTLVEKDKRKPSNGMRLVYPRDHSERIYVPDNLFIIGTMNIADRSLALVDFAFRRRFAFDLLEPALNKRWRKWCTKEANVDQAIVDHIQKVINSLNDQIANDRSLGSQFKIGHSYFTPAKGEVVHDSGTWFVNIVESELLPLLDEYWFDNPDQVEEAKKSLLVGL